MIHQDSDNAKQPKSKLLMAAGAILSLSLVVVLASYFYESKFLFSLSNDLSLASARIDRTNQSELITISIVRPHSPQTNEVVRNFPCSVGCQLSMSSSSISRFSQREPDVLAYYSDTSTVIAEDLLDSLKRASGPQSRQKVVLLTPTEAPPCRLYSPEVCQYFHYKVALTSWENVTVPVTMATTAILPKTGWYSKPTFCTKPDSCIGAVMASVSSPTQLQWERTEVSLANTSPGKVARGHWTWDLAKTFTVINYSAIGWVSAQLDKPNGSEIDKSRCFPSEQAYCDELFQNNQTNGVSRGGAGKSMQWIAKLLMGAMYKFTLEIENKQIDGYITEKFYLGFLSRTLMVYCGPKNAKVFAPGDRSYIDCHDFEDAYQLASHLDYLNGNHTAYLEYFEWKKRPLRPEFLNLFQRSSLGRQNEGLHDWSFDLLDVNAWENALPHSLESDPGWPSNTADRAESFISTFATKEYRQTYDNFVSNRMARGETWVCDICKQVASERNIQSTHKTEDDGEERSGAGPR